MYEVINSLLEYSVLKRENLNFQSVSPHKAIQEAEKKLQELISQSKAHISVNHLPQKVCAAYSYLVEVFYQLIKNAIIFCECDVPEIEISSWQKNDRHIFSVKDNGIGIEKEYSERIFMIFQRLHPKDNYPGAGLGLTLCKKIVRLHGGEIWLQSEPGKGSTFFFDLPASEKADSLSESFRFPENN
jgi:light-regulated signal transduction histidine kinase (bacteriophytochrome)